MVIFLYGPDTYSSRRKLYDLKKKFIEKKDRRGLNIAVFEASDLNIDSFRQAVLSQGLFTKKRLIIIENLLKQKREKILIQEILNYLRKIRKDEDNVVIFWEGTIELKNLSEEQKIIFDLLRQEKYSQEFPILKDIDLIKWIQKEVIKRGGKIQLEAAQFLSEKIGPDLWYLSNELDKILANKKVISFEDLKDLSYLRPEENIWLLVDAVGEKNKKRALKLLSDQIEIGTPFGWILSMLARQYRILLQAKEVMNSAQFVNHYQLAEKINLHPFICQKVIEQAKKYSLDELKKIYNQLLEIDIKIKTTSVEPEVLFDLLIINH